MIKSKILKKRKEKGCYGGKYDWLKGYNGQSRTKQSVEKLRKWSKQNCVEKRRLGWKDERMTD